MLISFKTKLILKQRLTSDVFLFRFQLVDPLILDFIAGQYMILLVPQTGKEPICRLYSIASSEKQTDSFELIIKLVDGGVGSDYLSKLQLGDLVNFQGPAGQFFLRESNNSKVFLATGTGIAPMMSIINKQLTVNKKQEVGNSWQSAVSTVLLWGVATFNDVFFLDRLKQIKLENSEFDFKICLSREKDLSITKPEDQKFFALGHPRHNLHPGLMVMYTIFLREHNRVCDKLLQQESTKNLNDDQLFEIARKVLTGILLKLVVNSYIQHINPSKNLITFTYKPELLQEIKTWNSTPANHRIAQEFNLLYRWHHLIPNDVIDIDGKATYVPDTFWDTDYLTSRGVDNVIAAAVKQPANQFGFRNSPRYFDALDTSGVLQARDYMKLQSYNKYCTRYGPSKANSFKELNPDGAEAFEKAYKHVDDVDFFVGIMNQKVQLGIFPPTLTRMVLAHAMNGIFANALSIKGKWTENTFGGGQVAYDAAANVTLKALVSRNTNVKEKFVSFSVQAWDEAPIVPKNSGGFGNWIYSFFARVFRIFWPF